MIYKRKIYSNLLKHAKSPMVTVLTGMRRTGKTTLVKQLLLDLDNKNSLYLDLQRPDNRELFLQKNYDSIYEAFISRGLSKNKPMIVALDEIQLAPDSPSAIKYLFDNKKIKFIVTGSSSYYLKNLFTESLSGRKKLFELYPLDFGEFLTFKEVNFTQTSWQKKPFNKAEYDRLCSYYEEYIRYGGFPQVVLAQSAESKKDILWDIISSYINIDIRSIADFADIQNLFSLAKLLASRIGSRTEYSTLSKLIGVSRPTVTNYVSFFEKTYLIRNVPIFTKNSSKEVSKIKKTYFCDTGLANRLADLSSGSQFENTVFNQLSQVGDIKYFSLKKGNEIDFILNSSLAIEAKETPTTNDVQALSRLSAVAGTPHFCVVSRRETPRFKNYIWGGSIT